MRILTIAAVAAVLSTNAFANDVFGIWKSEVNDEGGFIHVEIGPCASDGGKICGVIKDAFNEVPANLDTKRRDEIVGKTIIADMVADGDNEWGDGTIWAPDDDKTYDSSMELSGNTLEVSGCVLGGIICRGQDWTRLP